MWTLNILSTKFIILTGNFQLFCSYFVFNIIYVILLGNFIYFISECLSKELDKYWVLIRIFLLKIEPFNKFLMYFWSVILIFQLITFLLTRSSTENAFNTL